MERAFTQTPLPPPRPEPGDLLASVQVLSRYATYLVSGLLLLVALLVGSGLGLEGSLLLLIEGLPLLTEDLANITCSYCQSSA